MRRSLATAALVALSLTALAAPAEADPGGGATIITGKDGLTCAESEFGFAVTSHVIEVSTPGGVGTLTCYFSDVDHPTDVALRTSGFECVTVLGFTTDSSFVLTPSGAGTLVCRVKTS
jgi:hypothetical protein